MASFVQQGVSGVFYLLIQRTSSSKIKDDSSNSDEKSPKEH